MAKLPVNWLNLITGNGSLTADYNVIGVRPSSGAASTGCSDASDSIGGSLAFRHCCARGRAMPLGFGGIFFEVSAGVSAASKQRSVGQAQMALGTRFIGAWFRAARKQAVAHLLESLCPLDASLALGATELTQPTFQVSAN